MGPQERVAAHANLASEECVDDSCDCSAEAQRTGNKAYLISISALGGLIALSVLYNAVFG
jgi:hypothetical protein